MLLDDKFTTEDWRARLYPFFIFFVLAVVAFSLNIHASRDWHGYVYWFSYYSDKSWAEIGQILSVFKEPFYYVMTKFIGERIGFEAAVFIMISFALTLKLHFYRKITDNSWLVIYLYCCMYLFLFEGTQIRIALATALILVAMFFLKKQRWFYSVCWCLLASQFHLSSLIFLLAIPIYMMPVRHFWVLSVFFFLSPLLLLLELPIARTLIDVASHINHEYQEYYLLFNYEQNTTGLFYVYVLLYYALINGALYILRRRLVSDRFTQSFLGLNMLAVMAMCLLSELVVIAARTGELLLILSPVMLTYAVRELRETFYYRTTVWMLLVGFAGFCGARFLYLYPAIWA